MPGEEEPIQPEGHRLVLCMSVSLCVARTPMEAFLGMHIKGLKKKEQMTDHSELSIRIDQSTQD